MTLRKDLINEIKKYKDAEKQAGRKIPPLSKLKKEAIQSIYNELQSKYPQTEN
jgi:hypothetical protein